MKRILLILIITAALVLPLTAQDENWLSYNLNCQVLVEDQGSFSRDAADWAEQAGGYYTTLSPEYIVMRFPWQELSDFRTWLNQKSREIYQLDQSSQDLRENILGLKSGIEARQEVLDRNLEYLDRSDFRGTLSLEQEIRRLMQEIDSRQGQLRRLENDRKMVKAVVNISFLNNSLPESTYSSFDWINQVDFFQLIQGTRPVRSFKKVPFELPQGFALQRKGSVWKAISAEAVEIQLRWLKNYPAMEQPFWQETLELECLNRGYLPLNESRTIETNRGNQMVLMDWGIPYGQQDYHYITGFYVKGSKILVMEVSGPVLLLEPYMESINQAVKEHL